MGEIHLKTFALPQRHQNTQKAYSREVQIQRYEYILEMVAKNIPKDKACYIFGMGKHPKSTYENINGSDGVNVVWFGSLLPRYLYPLRFFMASYEGIVKVLDPRKLKDVFMRLSELSMVGLYIFDSKLETEFIDTVKKRKYSVYADQIVQKDPSYFIYQIDADNLESSTGIYEIVSYGVECKTDLTNALFT